MNGFVRAPTLAEVEVEQTVLALLLQGSETAWAVLDRITPQDMLETLHGRVLEAVRRVLDTGKEPGPLSVAAAMGSDKGLNEVGGANYLRDINERYGGNKDILPELCDALVDQGQKRALAREIAETEARLKDASVSASEIITEHEAAIRTLSEGRPAADEPESYYDGGAASFERQESDTRRKITLMPYGIPELDGETGGMAPGDLIILAGRPGMGKSAVALHIAHSLARDKPQLALELRAETKVTESFAVFMTSLEMERTALVQRGLSMRAYENGVKVPYSLIRQNKLSEKQRNALADALIQDRTLPFVIDHKPGQTVGQIGVRIRRASAKLAREGQKLGLGIIDHLGLILGDGNYRGNRVAELTDTTRGLKILAKSLGIPLVVLCQLSRAVEARDDKRPYLSDLRESGSIEQDADVVLLLHRPEYYLGKSKPDDAASTKDRDEWNRAMEREKNRLNIIIAKNRSGPEASIRVTCDMAYNWIGTL